MSQNFKISLFCLDLSQNSVWFTQKEEKYWKTFQFAWKFIAFDHWFIDERVINDQLGTSNYRIDFYDFFFEKISYEVKKMKILNDHDKIYFLISPS